MLISKTFNRHFNKYYERTPNRIDLLDLTVADAGVTLDLDKNWHSDLNENRDTSTGMIFCFKHVLIEITCKRPSGGIIDLHLRFILF